MNHFEPRHPDFSSYLADLRSHRRHDIRRSLRKGDHNKLVVTRLHDPEAIVNAYTREAHELYVAVVQRSAHRVELLPIQFFHALARAFPRQVELVLATIDNRIVGFNWSLLARGVFHLLFCGIDYAMNPQADVYFNLMYAELDRALRLGARDIQVGQTADTFKARMGCHQQPRYISVRAQSALVTKTLQAASAVLAPPPARPPRLDIYRSAEAAPTLADG